MVLEPARISPVDPQEFAFALQVGSAAFSYKMPMNSLSNQEFLVEDENGNLQKIALQDTPLNRAARAMRDLFPSDHEKFRCVMMRYFALIRLAGHAKMQKWQRPTDDPKSLAVDPAVFVVAAAFPVQPDGNFDAAQFFEKVEEVAGSGK